MIEKTHREAAAHALALWPPTGTAVTDKALHPERLQRLLLWFSTRRRRDRERMIRETTVALAYDNPHIGPGCAGRILVAWRRAGLI